MAGDGGAVKQRGGAVCLGAAEVQRGAGLHHLCLRVDSVDDVRAVSNALNATGIAATPAALHDQYAPDYWATFFTDPDGIRLEVTNYRAERRERHDKWES